MNISAKWLRELVQVEDFKKLSEKFNLMSMENTYYKLVEANNLVIGHVLEKEKHPEADKLNILKVDVGSETLQIVCGAPNVEKDQKVIIALIGAVLPGDFKIKKSKIRGVESFGMCCSLSELGIKEALHGEAGIHVLDSGAPVGGDVLEYLGLDDEIMELDLTPNRADLLSVMGTAYDAAAILNEEIALEEVYINTNLENPLNITLDTDKCSLYHARLIKGVKVKESPAWLKYRLMAIGLRPINNVVDITNYVLFHTGQPLHAFDYDLFNSNNIVVRQANENEEMTTLDEVKRNLNTADVVITNGDTAHCIAGVMGGLDSAVNENTTNILLESAIFNNVSVRKTSSRLNLRSDSSSRFEKGIAKTNTLYASDLATKLFIDLCEATEVTEVVSAGDTSINDKVIPITVTYLEKIIGLKTDLDTVIDIFSRLNFTVDVEGDTLSVNVPERRLDVNTKQDLVEEFVRIFGFENIPTTLPSTSIKGGLKYSQRVNKNIKNILTGIGLDEVITYSLINEKNVYDYTVEKEEIIKVMSSLSEDKETLRHTPLNGLMEVLSYNAARKISDMQIFEISDVYYADTTKRILAGAFTGIQNSSFHQQKIEKVDFFYVKGLVERLAIEYRLNLRYVKPSETNKLFNINQTAYIYLNDIMVGYITLLHPKHAKSLGLKDVYLFSLDMDIFYKEEKYVYSEIAKFPSISRDLAIICDKSLASSVLTDLIRSTAKTLLNNLTIFDVYTGENVADNEKSIAYKLEFLSKERTLEVNEINLIMDKIINKLESVGARLR